MDKLELIKNPVMHCPWVSRGPIGYTTNMQNRKRIWLNLSYKTNPSGFCGTDISTMQPSSTHWKHDVIQETSLLRNLNKSTLMMSFPEIDPVQIDSALILFDNDLSECISYFRRKRARVTRNPPSSSVGSFKQVAPKQNLENVKENVRYVPTNYPDVQIVEPFPNSNKMDREMVQMLQNCNTMIAPLIPTTVLSSDEQNLQVQKILKGPGVLKPNVRSSDQYHSKLQQCISAPSKVEHKSNVKEIRKPGLHSKIGIKVIRRGKTLSSEVL